MPDNNKAELNIKFRTITVDIHDPRYKIGVGQDRNSERVEFVLPRMYTGIDLSPMEFFVVVLYKGEIVNVERPEKTEEGDDIRLVWTIQHIPVNDDGTADLQIRAIGENFIWQTEIAKFAVARTILPSETPAQISYFTDVLTQVSLASISAQEAVELAKHWAELAEAALGGLAIRGFYSTQAALDAAVPNPQPGHAYAVGAGAPYDVYVWDGVADAWRNMGVLGGGLTAEDIPTTAPGTSVQDALDALAGMDPEGVVTSVNGVEPVGGNVALTAAAIPTPDGPSTNVQGGITALNTGLAQAGTAAAAAQAKADAAMPKAGGTFTGNITFSTEQLQEKFRNNIGVGRELYAGSPLGYNTAAAISGLSRYDTFILMNGANYAPALVFRMSNGGLRGGSIEQATDGTYLRITSFLCTISGNAITPLQVIAWQINANNTFTSPLVNHEALRISRIIGIGNDRVRST